MVSKRLYVWHSFRWFGYFIPRCCRESASFDLDMADDEDENRVKKLRYFGLEDTKKMKHESEREYLIEV